MCDMDKLNIVFEDGRKIQVDYGTNVRALLKKISNEDIIALRINGAAVPANYELTEDAKVNFIYADDRNGKKIYIAGLKYVYIKAIKDILGPKAVVNIKHSLDKGLYSTIEGKSKIEKSFVGLIKQRMTEIIESDLDFNAINVSKDDAIDFVNSNNEPEKVLNYTYMINDSVTMYELDGEYNYFYDILPASTGILKKFDLKFINPNGIVLCYPLNGVVPKYNPAPKVLTSFQNYEDKLKSIGVKYAGDINKLIVDSKISDFIQINEILYDENLGSIANMMNKDRNIRAVFISGPSSSGKTTTSKKLALFLNTFGLDTLVLSTDDYFVEREDSPRKPDGSYEFEIIDAIDTKLFNKQVRDLLDGKEVVIPTFNFITGKKEYKRKPTKLNKNQILIVEGLHAISERMSSAIDAKNKLKLYISPFMPVALDRHNHIKTTDLRLIRRMVRDYNHRGYSAEQTLTNWMGMRYSEETYIYPYQREADIVLNTSLAYEIGVLKTYVEPLLYSINRDSEFYEEAVRILKFIDCFFSIPSELVPQKSVLREFIGNSYFE